MYRLSIKEKLDKKFKRLQKKEAYRVDTITSRLTLYGIRQTDQKHQKLGRYEDLKDLDSYASLLTLYA